MTGEPQTHGERGFVGRTHEIEQLEAGLREALRGRGRMFLLSGEPGIGKTRLASEVGSRAEDGGMRVLWGRCWDAGGAPAHWPWRQILRSYARQCEPEELRAEIGNGISEVSQIAPEIARGCGFTPESTPEAQGADDASRFRLFDSTTLLLKRAAARQPLALVLDDLHAADHASLLLLQFLARELRDAPLLVIGTHREAEVRRVPALASIFANLARDAESIRLAGLSPGEVGALMAQALAKPFSSSVVATLHGATDGNPFFLDELLQLVADSPSVDIAVEGMKVPDRVREAIRQRLQPLTQESQQVLTAAAIIGREFDAELLERITGIARLRLLEALEEAALLGAIRESDDVGVYRFAHALIREAMRLELSPTRRMQLHLEVGNAIETGVGLRRDNNFAELAHHFLQAAPVGGADKALEYALRAAAQALQQWAYDEAATHYEQALAALNFVAPDERRRCDLLLDLGEAHRRAGNDERARESFRRAATIARRIDAADLFASAALGLGRGGETGGADQLLIELLEEARQRLPRESDLHIRVSSRLAMALQFSAVRDRGVAISEAALDEARRSGDSRLLVTALVARHFVVLQPGTTTERLALSAEIVRIADSIGDHDVALEGRLWRTVDLLEAADGESFRRSFEDYRRLTDVWGVPVHRWHVETMRATEALLECRLEEAERLSLNAAALGQRASIIRAPMALGVQTVQVRRQQGRSAELVAAAESFAAAFPNLPIWRCGLAQLYADSGRTEAAVQILDQLVTRQGCDLRFDANWLAAVALLCDVCVTVERREAAAVLYDTLTPFAGCNVLIAELLAYFGPVDLFLGRLATLLDRHDAAARHLHAAEESMGRYGAPLVGLEAKLARARVLLRLDKTTEAVVLIDEVRTEAQRRGLTRIETLAAALAAPLPPQASDAAGRRSATEEALFRRDGETWSMRFGDATARLKHSRGFLYIACLLEHPGREYLTLDLVHAVQGTMDGVATAKQFGHDELAVETAGGDAILDPQAKNAYRRRLADLREELEEANEFNDRGRIERLQDEIDAITQELSAAIGLGGRDRVQRSNAERSRVAVTKAIRIALKLIETAHPALGHHLSSTIKTGRFCSYEPNPEQRWRWQVQR